MGEDGCYHRADSDHQDADYDFDSGDEGAFNVLVGKHRPPECTPGYEVRFDQFPHAPRGHERGKRGRAFRQQAHVHCQVHDCLLCVLCGRPRPPCVPHNLQDNYEDEDEDDDEDAMEQGGARGHTSTVADGYEVVGADWSGRPGQRCQCCGRRSENVGPRRGFDYRLVFFMITFNLMFPI